MTIRLTVPAKREHLHVVRSVVGGAAAKASLTIDDVEDLRLAIDEACAHLLSVVAGASTLTVEVNETPHSIEVYAGVDAAMAAGTGDDGVGSYLTWHILEALTDTAAMQPGPNGGAGILMTKHTR